MNSWRSFLHEHEWKNYLVNSMELVMMQNQEGEFQAQLEGYMTDLEQSDAGTAERELSIVTQASDSLSDYPYCGKTVFLCGVSFNPATPWEEVVSGATA